MGRVKRVLVTIGLVAAAVVAGSLFIQSDYYLYLPDRARPVDALVTVPGEKKTDTNPNGGGIYMVDVLVTKASLAERVFPDIRGGSTLVPAKTVNPAGVSQKQLHQQGLNQMTQSQEDAVTVALRHLGYKVKVSRDGAQVVEVDPKYPAQGELEVGDVIVEARGLEVKSPDDLQRAMAAVKPGQAVDLVVNRDKKEVPVTVETTKSPNPKTPDKAIFGIVVQQAAEYTFPIDIKFNSGAIGGPSAGLAFSLDIVDELGDDLDKGRKIAVTGTIDLAGHVGEIGGIKQKTIGARQSGATILLVPDANAAGARRYAEDMKIVPVTTFDEALAKLGAE
jgi:PDZ domain-containing protein